MVGDQSPVPPRFNWATPVKAWRFDSQDATTLCNFRLQLGHAGEGVEILKETAEALRENTLQLGHAGEGVEIAYNRSGKERVCVLQLGHAGEGVEICWRVSL